MTDIPHFAIFKNLVSQLNADQKQKLEVGGGSKA